MYPSGRLRDFHMGSSTIPAPPEIDNSDSPGDWSRKERLSACDQASNSAIPGTANLGDNPGKASLSNPSASVGHSSFSGQFQSLLKAPASFVLLSTGQTLTVPNRPPSVSKNFNQSETYKSSSLIENAQSAGHDQAYSNYGHLECFQSNCMSPKVYDKTSRRLYPSGNLHQKLVEPAFSAVGADGSEEGRPNEINQKERHDVDGIIYPSAVETDYVGSVGCFMEHKNANFELIESQLVADNSTCYYQGDTGAEASTRMIKLQSETQNSKHFSLSEIPSKYVEIRTENTKSDGGLSKSSERNESAVVIATHSEKLWDGSLQLSSSLKVSVAACFKSGEKMPDVSWPKHVEVKGKTRLDAFEKYIQDLPRSRSRGLTVLSLCWKEGSSDAELKAMKEVASRYEEGERVGFARISSGFDLYICPHSDTIFTILDKHGFLKRMVAVDKNQGPLIGCAVWRKSRVFDPVTTRLQKIGSQSVPSSCSPSSSSVQQVAGKDSSKANLNQATVQPTLEKKLAAVGDLGENGRESESIESSNAQEFGNSSSSVTPVSLSIGSSSIHIGGRTLSPGELASVQVILSKLSEIEASILQNLGVKNQTGNLELLKSVLPPSSLEILNSILAPPDAPKETTLVPDDDDLPEFDFQAAVSQIPSSKLGTAEVSTELISSQIPRDNNGSSLGLRGQVQGAPSQMGCSHNMTAIANSPTLGTKTKNIFDDDDDDMPEWHPSYFEQPKPLPQAQRPGSLIASNSKDADPLCVYSTSGPLPPLLPTPSPFAQFRFSAQTSPPQPANAHRRWGAQSSTEVRSLRPQLNPCDQSRNLSIPRGGVDGCRDGKKRCRSSNSSSAHLCRHD